MPSLALLDFQTVALQEPLYDIGYCMALSLTPLDLEKHEERLLGICFERLKNESKQFASSVYGAACKEGFKLFELRYQAITMMKLAMIVLMSPNLIAEDPKQRVDSRNDDT